eukprot:CAMPEP_0195622510 /NCGR_PEP_ID=MMETSP0815-20121206/16253_1 /TAXON_ID=97485 /ORGANISM="Prymnesium parvum, Strain Texoma1" /LENGTH=138 /DNA_ID=CAMNT_0040763315 /DNA_START=153 /DNA_END=570 /DNA_ORIENTATION=+
MVRLVHVPARFMVHTVHLGVLWINGRIEIVGLAENIVAHNVARRFFSLLRAASASAAASAASASFALRSSSRSSFFAVNPPNISSMSSFSLEVGRRAAAAAVTLSASPHQDPSSSVSSRLCVRRRLVQAMLDGDSAWR